VNNNLFYLRCIDIFIERTNKLELDASSKGKIAMLLVNCVKENNENDSSFKLVFAGVQVKASSKNILTDNLKRISKIIYFHINKGHVYEHFRLLSDDHEYAKQVLENYKYKYLNKTFFQIKILSLDQ